jgi:phosphoribosylformylglycinamidine synthase subunit PurSL
MPSRIEVASDVINAEGNSVRNRIASGLGIHVDEVRVIDAYILDGELTQRELERLGSTLFADPTTQRFSGGRPAAKDFDWAIDVGYRPGVTDNAGRTASQAVEEMLGRPVDVYTSKQYLLRGRLTPDQVDRIGHGMLANSLIETVSIKSSGEWDSSTGFGDPVLPFVCL